MSSPAPLKRHPAIVPFSKDHHFGLLLVWKIREGMKKEIAPGRINDYILYFYNNGLNDHFTDEEQWLFSRLPVQDPLRVQAESEHQAFRSLIKQLEVNKEGAALSEQIADTLEKHIRFEERVLFKHLQEIIGPDELLLIEKQMSNKQHNHEEDWPDEFWKA